MSNDLTPTKKAELILSILKGELTVGEVCNAHFVSPLEVQDWIDDAVSSVGSKLKVYEKLRKVKTRIKMHILPGGSLACIRFHHSDEPFGAKSNYWCSSMPLPQPAAGEVILNYSRSDCRLAEIDVVFAHLCLPHKYRDSDQEGGLVDLDMELDFKNTTATIRLDRADKNQTLHENPYWCTELELPPPLYGSVLLGIHKDSSLLYNIVIRHADKCLPSHFFSAQ